MFCATLPRPLLLEDEHELDVPLTPTSPCRESARAKVAIRPERVKVFYKDELPFGLIRFDAILKDTVFLGDACRSTCRCSRNTPSA